MGRRATGVDAAPGGRSTGSRAWNVLLAALALAGAAMSARADADGSGPPWWWDEPWWTEGRLPAAENHAVETRWTSYRGPGADVPALVARPRDGKRHPAVLYLHGRRGLDDLIQLQVKRIAARGFVVLAPDLYAAHFIPAMPVEHDYNLEADAARAVDALLALPDVSTRRACVASHTRGGYVSLKVAVGFKRQERDLACYFREPAVRTFADDLASQDALRRAAAFMRRHLAD